MGSKQDHSKFHSPDAFCSNAGPEELGHLQELIGELTDRELVSLVGRVGIDFFVDPKKLNRKDYENVIDEAAREDFYREYRKIIKDRERNNGETD